MIEIVLAALFFGLVLIAIKLSTPHIYPLLGAIIISITSFVIQAVAIVVAKSRGAVLTIATKGVLYSLLAGLFLGVYTIFLFFALSKFDISKATPFVYVGAIVISFLFGVSFLKEPFSMVHFVGLLLATVGLFLLFWR